MTTLYPFTVSARNGYSLSGYTTSGFAFTYEGNEMVKNVYSSKALMYDSLEPGEQMSGLRLPIMSYNTSGIYVGLYSDGNTYYIDNENDFQNDRGTISSSGTILIGNTSVEVNPGDIIRSRYDGKMYEVYQEEEGDRAGEYSLRQIGTNDYNFNIQEAGVIFYPNGEPYGRTIQVNQYGYYNDPTTEPKNCEIANKCYVSATTYNAIAPINLYLETDSAQTVYHEDYDYLKDADIIIPFFFSPNSASEATSAWTMVSNYYVCWGPEGEGYSVNFSNSRVNATYGFYETSDEQYKNVLNDVSIDFETLIKIPKFYFTWKFDKNNSINIGTSAQRLKEIYPELVYEANNGILNVDYGKLSIIALKAVDMLYLENLELKERLRRIEEKLGL